MFRTDHGRLQARILPCILLASVVIMAIASNGPAIAADEIAKLGEPRRNIVAQARSAQEVAQHLASARPGTAGVIPLMIFPSNSLVVENAFNIIQSSASCRSIFTAYDQRLRSQHGDKIRHGLYCVSIANGKVQSIDTVAKSY